MNIVEITKASQIREIAKPIFEQKYQQEQTEKRIKELEEQIKLEQRTLNVINYIMNKIEELAKAGEFNYYSEIHSQYYNFNLEVIEDVFTRAGYQVHVHYYSDSWVYKSGKVAYINITWYK